MRIDARTVVGLVLVIAGVVAVVTGGFSVTSERHEAEVGPLELAVHEKERVSIPLWAGVATILAGAAVLAVRRR